MSRRASYAGAGLATVLLTAPLATTAYAVSPGASTSVADSASRSCRTLAPGTSMVPVTYDGKTYDVRVHVPTGAAKSGKRTKLPLVLDLHGSNSNGIAQADISDLTALADERGFIVANPTAAIPLPTTTPLPDGNWAWNVPGVPTTAGAFPPAGARDDVGFLAAVITQLSRGGCVDSKRVYLTGYSGGGRMSSAFACARSDLVAAIAPVAGLRAGRPDPDDVTVPELGNCAPKKPVAVLTFHGIDDMVNPLLGSNDLRWGYAASLAVQTWARLDECTSGPDAVPVSEHVTKFSYTGCHKGADVTYYRVSNGGHTWPGTDAALPGLGLVTQEISASRLMTDFFFAHPKR